MNSQTKKITYSALMMALVFVMTFIVRIPLPTGYIHLGDAAVLLSAYILGPWAGLLAAGLGSAGADYFGGYAAYMIPTFIAKGSMAFIFGYFIKRYPARNILFFAFPAIIDMALIYFVAEVIMYGSIVSPFVNIPFSILQGTVGIVIMVILYKPLERFKLTEIQSE